MTNSDQRDSETKAASMGLVNIFRHSTCTYRLVVVVDRDCNTATRVLACTCTTTAIVISHLISIISCGRCASCGVIWICSVGRRCGIGVE